MVMVLNRFNPLRRIGLETDQVSVLSDLCHCQTEAYAEARKVLIQGLGVVPLDYVIRATRAGCCPAYLRTKLEGSLPKGYNDHPVPPADAVYYLLALFAGDGIVALLL
ncbi:hypothetical protein PIB30_014794 [Stylosanthes scabra]|uniref:Uncharacterized protein n=1 Tax=Stylosanthes scabra TaxID=79078 RepID=A0ABU6Z5C8_9FABA|nr:hypothetical protein [Stylosanthes scabra]